MRGRPRGAVAESTRRLTPCRVVYVRRPDGEKLPALVVEVRLGGNGLELADVVCFPRGAMLGKSLPFWNLPHKNHAGVSDPCWMWPDE